MKKVKNKLLLMFLVIVLSASGLIGCKSDESKPTESQTDISDTKGQETEKEIETSRLSDYPEGTFDGEEVCKHIEINGKVVEFPWTLNKLGDEYEFEDVKIYENIYVAKLIYNGEYMFDVIGNETSVNRNTSITYITLTRDKNVKICGISCENTLSDVEDTFGKPSETGKDSIKYSYWYKTEGICVFFKFDYNNIVDTIGISISDNIEYK